MVAVGGRTCRVALRRDYCAACPVNQETDQRRRCGVGFAFPREIELETAGLACGDHVLVGVSRVGVAVAAAVMFGLPLGLMLVAAAAAQVVWSAALAGAAAGLTGGAALAFVIARRSGLDDRVGPILAGIPGREDDHTRDDRAATGEKG
ncbi:MAG: SoxR reducing system RseC family protein [Gammaproteobacteria bacterium]|nr:SoxR reducing system RseC family protein [Gammaproteobacteria bacterium]